MKTAISIPDHVFKAAEELARRLGKSRSELYSAAIASYVDRHRQEGMTERLNEVYGPRKEQAELDAVLATLQSLSISEEDWQVRRGEVWWVTLPAPVDSEPGHRRPVVIIQSDPFNQSRIGTAIAPHSPRTCGLRQRRATCFCLAEPPAWIETRSSTCPRSSPSTGRS